MYKKTLYLVSFVVVLALVSNASAVNYHWWKDTDPANSDWNSALNWSNGLVPQEHPTDSETLIGDAGTGTVGACVIDGINNPFGSAANSQWMTVGFNWTGTLNVVAGGHLGTGPWSSLPSTDGPVGELFVGSHGSGDFNANGTINIDGAGSTAQAEGWRIGNGPWGGIGTVNITDGGAMIGGWWGMRIGPTGTVNIIDGTMHVWGTSEPMNMTGTALIDIGTNGKLTLSTNQLPLVAGYIAANQIVANGGASTPYAYFDGTDTVVIPEPATVLLLGLGGLLLRRRRA